MLEADEWGNTNALYYAAEAGSEEVGEEPQPPLPACF